MKKNLINDDHFKILRLVKKKPKSSLKMLARKLAFSTVKMNHCLKTINIKDLVQTRNFKENSNILSYFYARALRDVAIKIALNN